MSGKDQFQSLVDVHLPNAHGSLHFAKVAPLLNGWTLIGGQNKWDETATDGSFTPPGRPFTLTYSFVPDGTWIPSNGGPIPPKRVDRSPSIQFAVLDNLYGSTEAWQQVYHDAMAKWSDVSGITFVDEPGRAGLDLPR